MVLIAFSTVNKDPWSGPSRVSEADLAALFNQATGWRVDSIEDTNYELGGLNAKHPGFTTHAFLMAATRL